MTAGRVCLPAVPALARDALAGRAGPARLAGRAGSARAVAAAAAWLYLYCALWLTTYAALTTFVFGWTPVVITGGSMRPHILPGDVVMVGDLERPAGAGAVLTFRAPAADGLVTHRVVEVLPEGYRTRGDANGVDDSAVVAPGDVVGSGRLLIPLLGRPLAWLSAGAVLPAAGWLLGTVLAVVVVRRHTAAARVPATGPGVHQPGSAPADAEPTGLDPAAVAGHGGRDGGRPGTRARDVLPKRAVAHARLPALASVSRGGAHG